MVKKILFFTSFVFEMLIILFMIFLCVEGIIIGTDFLIAIPIIVLFILNGIISMKAFVSAIRNPTKKQVRNSILMKLTLFFTVLSFSFLGVADGIYAFGLFLFAGVIFAAITMAVIKYNMHPTANMTPKVNNNKYEFRFKGKYLWDNAASEYMYIHGLTDISELSEEDNNKIYDYAVGPFSYFFYYMVNEGMCSDAFYESVYEILGNEYLYKLEKKLVTPIDLLSALDYSFDESDINEGFLPFFRSYYDDGGIFYDKQSYVYDYCDATESMGEAYYCIDFSWDLADQIYKIIKQRYEDYNRRLYRYDRVDFYKESEEVEGVTRTFLYEKFNCYIDVRRAGPIYMGNITAEYVDKCIEALKNLSEIQIDKLRRRFDGIYGDIERDKDIVALFYSGDDLTLYIMDPKEEGDVVFTMSGGTAIDPEHGLSFLVRNGRIVCFGYGYEIDDIYTEENIRKYNELVDEIDYISIKTSEDLNRLVAEGRFVKLPVKPDIAECKYVKPSKHIYPQITDELIEAEYMYVPLLFAKKLEEIEHKLRIIIKYAKAKGLLPEICYSFHFYTDENQDIVSKVPKDIIIRSTDHNSWLNIVFDVNIWS